jgi:serine/threonine-protein kinase
MTEPSDGVDPYLGRTIAGKFQILDLLGQGGMGKVYRAKHVTLEKTVCIKMLRPALLDDHTVVGRFEREAKSASRLNHGNSIQVLDFGQDEFGTLYIAMEFVSGKDLRKTLRDEFPLGEERICHIVGQVLSALAEAHAQNVIHRDLKPENIMLEQRRGEPDFVKVLDFGIAKIQDPDVPGLTRADVVCGTPLYMSPEQATGAKFDHRSDLYAIGVILYQLSTGTLPFDGSNSMEILTKHVMELAIPPRTRRPEVSISPDMESLIMRALAKDPAERPQTAEAFRAELLKIQERLRRQREESAAAALEASTQHKEERTKAIKEKQAAQLASFSGGATAAATTSVASSPAPKSKLPLIIGGVVGLAIAGAAVVFLKPAPAPEPKPEPAPARPSPAAIASPSPSSSSDPVPLPEVAPKPNPSPAAVSPSPAPSATPSATPAKLAVVPSPEAKPAVTPVVERPANLPPLIKGNAQKAKILLEEADLSYEEGNYAEAISGYRQAIKADPSFAKAYYGLYRAGMTSKDKKAQREGGEGYLRAAPNAPDAERIKQALAGL